MSGVTTNLLVPQPGQQAAQYITLASGFQLLDNAIAGQVNLAGLAAADYALSDTEFQFSTLVVPALAAARVLVTIATTSASGGQFWWRLRCDGEGGGPGLATRSTGRNHRLAPQ